MYNILNNINILLSALKPSQYREYVKGWNKERYSEIFGDKDRIYLPDIINSSAVDLSAKSHDILYDEANEIRSIINSYAVVKLHKKFYFVDVNDYIKGILYENNRDNREYKIGKLLNDIKKSVENDIKYVQLKIDSLKNSENKTDLYMSENYLKLKNVELDNINNKIQLFNSRPSFKEMSKKLTVVISRHPYDIAGMSTDRNWTSCMELPNKDNSKGGCYYNKISSDIKYGTLVAYLINEDDKNINKPLARIAIKPFYNKYDKFDNTIILKAEQKVYGGEGLFENTLNDFQDIVNNWCISVNKKIEEGVFEKPKELYDDSNGLNNILFYYGDLSFDDIINKILNSKDKIQNYANKILDERLTNTYLVLNSEITTNLMDLFYVFDDKSEVKLKFSYMFYNTIKEFINDNIKLDNGTFISRDEFLKKISVFLKDEDVDPFYIDYLESYNIIIDILKKSNNKNLSNIFLKDAFILILSTDNKNIDYDKYDYCYDNRYNTSMRDIYKKVPNVLSVYLIPAENNGIEDSVIKWNIDLAIYNNIFKSLNENKKMDKYTLIHHALKNNVKFIISKKYKNEYADDLFEIYNKKFENIYNDEETQHNLDNINKLFDINNILFIN